jgi:hypothetical protein
MKPIEYVKRDLCLQPSIGNELAGLDAKPISNILDWMRIH